MAPPADRHSHTVVPVQATDISVDEIDKVVENAPPVGVGDLPPRLPVPHPFQQMQEPSRLLHVLKHVEQVRPKRVLDATEQVRQEVIHKLPKMQYEPLQKPKEIEPLPQAQLQPLLARVHQRKPEPFKPPRAVLWQQPVHLVGKLEMHMRAGQIPTKSLL